jgi:hypothetical protein
MDMAERNDKLDPVLDISPDGDVVLVVCWIKNVILEKTEVLIAMENNLYL